MDLMSYDDNPKMIIDDGSQSEHDQEFLEVSGRKIDR